MSQELKHCPWCNNEIKAKTYPWATTTKGMFFKGMIDHECINGLNIIVVLADSYASEEDARNAIIKKWNNRNH